MMFSKHLMIVMGVLLAVAILASSAATAATYTWTGGAKYSTWWRSGNWSGGSGRPGVDNAGNSSNTETAKLRYYGKKKRRMKNGWD